MKMIYRTSQKVETWNFCDNKEENGAQCIGLFYFKVKKSALENKLEKRITNYKVEITKRVCFCICEHVSLFGILFLKISWESHLMRLPERSEFLWFRKYRVNTVVRLANYFKLYLILLYY